MRVPLLDLKAQYRSIKEEIDEALARVHERGNYVMGEEVEAFEEEWALVCQARYAVGVGSGTEALYLALRAVGCTGISVLTSPATFFATVEAILMTGNTPIFLDVDRDGLIDISQYPGQLECAIPVHLYGCPAPNVVEARVVRTDAGSTKFTWIIEDACQAHGLPLRGDVACYSFYPSKNLGAYGQAGAVVTNREAVAQAVRLLRNHGDIGRFHHHEIGGNYRMDELQAAVLRAKLPHLQEWNEARRRIARYYRSRLAPVADIIGLPRDHPQHNWHIFNIRLERREALAGFLAEKGIQTSVRYPVPMHQVPAINRMYFHQQGLEEAEAWARESLSLPIYPEMTDGQVEYVATSILEWARR